LTQNKRSNSQRLVAQTVNFDLRFSIFGLLGSSLFGLSLSLLLWRRTVCACSSIVLVVVVVVVVVRVRGPGLLAAGLLEKDIALCLELDLLVLQRCQDTSTATGFPACKIEALTGFLPSGFSFLSNFSFLGGSVEEASASERFTSRSSA
jgi:hypothetical protein